MPSKKQNTSLPREEDYRDFEERNIRDGWPYSDQPDAAPNKPKNRAYGEPEANFDREQKSGFSIEGKEEVGTDSQLTSKQEPIRQSDDLEVRVTEYLESMEDLDINSIDVHARGGTIILEGAVETAAIARKIELAVLSFHGVRHVRNNLRVAGVDARVPDQDV
ncbi:BON domain-containing protein [Sinorhizobium sp. 8-89]|uniref:BON domain-containing protein n=1 Tax=Sinorhizobium sp. 7-81 TaxID=3049087 RepID=UPI0024C293ED|nr:BON domain-containing protein [Sinorhizobium sp. 7-81]MDK1384653.1 BON domain-containing protein [Sinorhizobium sp. 7-81]